MANTSLYVLPLCEPELTSLLQVTVTSGFPSTTTQAAFTASPSITSIDRSAGSILIMGITANYRSGTANSNTVNSKFHLIRSFNQDFARFLSFHV